jgi:hypothetical protein
VATASAYDQYEDAGIAFAQEDVDGYDPAEWAAGHVEALAQYGLTVRRRAELETDKPVWWAGAAKRMDACIGWMCVALELNRAQYEVAMPEPKTASGKRNTTLAHALTPQDVVGHLREGAIGGLVYTVSIGRRKRGTKLYRSQCNKLANALVQQLHAADKLEEELQSRKSDS